MRGPIRRGSRVRRRTWTSCGLTGTFTDLPDAQRECPQHRHSGLFAGTGGAVNAYTASNQPMWDISNTTTWITGSHTFNFGVNYRRWWLQRDLATGFLGNYGFNVGFTGNPVADMLLGYYSGVGRLPARGIQRAGRARQSPRVQFQVFRTVLPGRLEGDVPPHGEPGSAVGLPQRALRDEQPDGLAEPRLRARRSAGRRPVARGRRHRGWRVLPVSRAGEAPRTRIGSRCSLRGSGLPGGRSTTRRPSSAAATACSSIRPKAVRSTARRTSTRTSAAATTSSRSGSRRRCRRSDSLFPSFAAPGRGDASREHVPRGQPVAAAAKPLRAAVVARRAARADREHDARAELHRHEGDEPADAAQHRAGASLHAGPPDGGRAQAVSQLRRLHRQRLGRHGRTTTRSTRSSSIAAAARC